MVEKIKTEVDRLLLVLIMNYKILIYFAKIELFFIFETKSNVYTIFFPFLLGSHDYCIWALFWPKFGRVGNLGIRIISDSWKLKLVFFLRLRWFWVCSDTDSNSVLNYVNLIILKKLLRSDSKGKLYYKNIIKSIIFRKF